ncbi:LacI family DNA-binding transcriptional regulator [Demequina iriomotensis]|uniref:LacI family DNA-binding transcriptional regulator n=1 Tax=Demequina iriomotensis TaxID=1536641 RepID=UPI000781F945|nr:LacI family DNA-binding transcriptional regulator [Demequina iriomotensis]
MEPVARVKLADVARLAGVSVATVSKVVNGRYGVSKETVARVQEVIDEVGYAGNLSAAGLRGQRTNVLGILVGGFEPFSAELMKGAWAAAEGSGYELLAHSGGHGHGWERRSLARLGGTLIDGAILVTPTVLNTATGVPVVAIDPHYGPSSLPTVDSHNVAGARAATTHLIELGHRRVAFLGGRHDLDSGRRREEGFRTAMEAAGVEIDEDLVVETNYEPELAAHAAESMLSLPERPTAIFAANDTTALAAMDVALDMGLSVPYDLSIVGFDDIPEAAAAPVPLTTVRQPLQEMGAEAMHMLLALVGGEACEQHVRMDTSLVVRESTAEPR